MVSQSRNQCSEEFIQLLDVQGVAAAGFEEKDRRVSSASVKALGWASDFIVSSRVITVSIPAAATREGTTG
jgi:hypothetical protein